MSKEFEVGDEVCVSSGYGPSTHKLTVTRKLKRYIECDDGSKWNLNGQRYGGSKDPWSVAYLRHWGEDNDRALLLWRVNGMWSRKCKSLSLDQLKRIAVVLKEVT